ncbi:unnamed protein product, partial [marine sediment metagenome]
MHSTIEYLDNHHLKYLTIYGFSTENWSRDPDEIEGLFQLYAEVLNKESHELYKRGVRLRHVGHLDELPPYVQLATNRAVDLTKNNTGMTLSFAFNYGGSIEIIDAVRRLIDEGVPSQLVDENLFSRYLYTDGIPDVDLVIRTAGELRQAIYSDPQTLPDEAVSLLGEVEVELLPWCISGDVPQANLEAVGEVLSRCGLVADKPHKRVNFDTL